MYPTNRAHRAGWCLGPEHDQRPRQQRCLPPVHRVALACGMLTFRRQDARSSRLERNAGSHSRCPRMWLPAPPSRVVMHRALIVDDDQSIRTVLRAALRDEGWTVQEVDDGAAV